VKFFVDHSEILFDLIFSTVIYVTLVTFTNDTNMGLYRDIRVVFEYGWEPGICSPVLKYHRQ